MFEDKAIKTIEDIKRFLKSSSLIKIKSVSTIKERAEWILERLLRFKYRKLSKKEKRIARKYLSKITGAKDRTIKYHITAYKKGEYIGKTYKRNSFVCKYNNADKELLAETDNLHSRINGVATRAICKKMYEQGDIRYKRIANISVSQLYNIRKNSVYKNVSIVASKTKSVDRATGKREKPKPDGKPGYIRVDTVHQGDQDGKKGVYHINLVDEITQWDVMVAVEGISEEFLIEAINGAINMFPFKITGVCT